MTIWEFALGALAVAGAFIIYVATKVAAHLVGEEVEGRLDQIGYALLRLACRRLPTLLREDYYREWAAELDAHFQGATERPLTRLYWSLCFPGPLLFRARAIAMIQDPEAFGTVPNARGNFHRRVRAIIDNSTATAVVPMTGIGFLGTALTDDSLSFAVRAASAAGSMPFLVFSVFACVVQMTDRAHSLGPRLGPKGRRRAAVVVSVLTRAHLDGVLLGKPRQNEVDPGVS
ncbi:hypothetical protein [Nocardia asiatica]|uniref:hypothetical protein n=1 Tax=Nocardia asiatica TaxID=209252 RepID=UPI0024590117|nr:hypothetical protein [Nocardia asiatica]